MPFDYATSFPAAIPADATNFQRSFRHQDWIDGESVVQAEANAVEEGFNDRFHKIEADLDALNGDAVRGFAALAAMRSSLRLLLDEIRTEFNRPSEPWTDSVLLNNWRSVRSTDDLEFPYGFPGSFKDRSGVVHLRGTVVGGPQPNPGGDGSEVFRLPEAHRSIFRARFVAATFNGFCRVELTEFGVIRVASGHDGTVFLTGISFRP